MQLTQNRSAFIKIWDKLKAASTEDGDGATTPAENGGKRKRQPKAATSRKDSNQLLGMYKLEGGKRAKKEQTKKPAKEESEESAKTEDHESDTKLSHDNDSEDGKSTPVPYQTPSPKEGNDEWWDADSQDAAVMGVSVEAYRAAVAYPTTPTGAGLSDDEA